MKPIRPGGLADDEMDSVVGPWSIFGIRGPFSLRVDIVLWMDG